MRAVAAAGTCLPLRPTPPTRLDVASNRDVGSVGPRRLPAAARVGGAERTPLRGGERFSVEGAAS
jgi:hypothetical protein